MHSPSSDTPESHKRRFGPTSSEVSAGLSPSSHMEQEITEFGIHASKHRRPVGWAALIGVLGIVYGDIGTSPIYALRATLFIISKNDVITPWEVLGIESLIFWSLILIVTIKYVILVMRVDYNGEGGILALMSLAQRLIVNHRVRTFLGIIGIIGTCLFFGDGMITPAISVLSAIEGTQVLFPVNREVILPIALLILVALFATQWRGTGRVGGVFGFVMVVWFITIGLLGLIEIIYYPAVLEALLPHHALRFILDHEWLSFIALGTVVLAVTGAEALYADMGHFGRNPIRYLWLFFVLPSLALNYLGQGALIISDPDTLTNPFFLLGPDWFRMPLLILATCATVIASQAGISGSFSLARQLIQLGYLPRMKIMHTNAEEEGQIYLPQFNCCLMLGALLLVIIFQNSNALAAAYGIAVTGTFLCSCVLAYVVFSRSYKWPFLASFLVFGSFFFIDASFFTANAFKIPQGGWVPLLFGAILSIMMTTWKKGRQIILSRQQRDSLPVASFLTRLPQARTIRVPGIAVFLTASPINVPNSLLHNLRHNKVLHEHILFVTIQNLAQPYADRNHQISLQLLAPNIYRIVIRCGFMESPNIPWTLKELNNKGVPFDPLQASYFVNRELIVRSAIPKMSLWRTRLFQFMARNATSATEFFHIPVDRVVELGVKISV